MSTRSRRATSAAGVMLLLASLIVAVGLPAAAIDGNCNTQGGWQENVTSGAWGSITNNGDGSVSVSLNAGYSLDLCVKGGSGYEVYSLTSSGGPFWPPANCGAGTQQCGLSHWAIRNVVLTTTTTTPSTTSTTPSTTSTTPSTTSTTPSTTSTTPSTTSTTPSTTSTQPTTTSTQPTTTSTQPTTTSTQPTTTSTQPPTTAPPTSTIPFDSVPEVETEVLGIQVSAPEAAQVATQETLPFTGISTGSMALLAAAFAGVGLLLLLAARQNEEKTPARSWN